MKKIYTTLVALFVIVSIVLQSNVVEGAATLQNSAPTFYSASSTVFTLTTVSQRLLATSTGSKRVAATIQPVNCNAVPAQAVFLNLNRDVAATANSGMAVYASTTQEFKDYPNLPVVQGTVNGITANGTCTVLVTEWRLIP